MAEPRLPETRRRGKDGEAVDGLLKSLNLQNSQKDQPRIFHALWGRIRTRSIADDYLANPTDNPGLALHGLDAYGWVGYILRMTPVTLFRALSAGWISALGVLPFFLMQNRKDTFSMTPGARDAAALLNDAARINKDAGSAFRKFQQAVHA